jgi:hypothetical protein
LPTKITPHGDHIVFHLRGVACRADAEDACTIASGSWRVWRVGIVDAFTKRLLARQLTGWRFIRFINGDNTDFRRSNLEKASCGGWIASRSESAKWSYCSSRGKWLVRRQLRGVRIFKTCDTEEQAKHYARLIGRIGSAELTEYKRRGCIDEQFEWLERDLSEALVARCSDNLEIARRAFQAGLKARDYIGVRNAEAIWK